MRKRILLSGLALLIIGVSLGIILPRVFSSNEKWSFQTGGGSLNACSPTVANGLIYVGSNRYLYALDASGRQQWSFDMAGIISDSPTVANGMVYVGANDAFGHLFALDERSGRQKWSFQVRDSIASSPVVVSGLVYVGSRGASNNGNLYALNAVSGSQKWSFHTGSRIEGGGISSSLAVANGIIYVRSDDGNLYALDALSGSKKWQWAYPQIQRTPLETAMSPRLS